MASSRSGLRTLDRDDLPALLELTLRDPVVNVFVEHRARSTRLDARALVGDFWGRFDDQGTLIAACHAGANLVPVGCDEVSAAMFAQRMRLRRRHIATLVGPTAAVRAMYDVVRPTWGAPRDERWGQPHLQTSRPSVVSPDPLVRRATAADLDVLYPACVAMYTEEVGLSPELDGHAGAYRARVGQLVSRGWSFVRREGDEIVFKAEVASVTPYAAQVQGVWTAPDRRGEGIGRAGMAAVVDLVLGAVAPTVSLYVNAWNIAARKVYDDVGFTQTAEFSTVMW